MFKEPVFKETVFKEMCIISITGIALPFKGCQVMHTGLPFLAQVPTAGTLRATCLVFSEPNYHGDLYFGHLELERATSS